MEILDERRNSPSGSSLCGGVCDYLFYIWS
nr:MAG TPA: hypothetical protein [Caudoviricetes sp.]DAT02987.1 MAG TPA: hypothetical protein [Caudoviricetes sp.]